MKRSELLKAAAVTDTLVAVFTLILDGDDGGRRDAEEMIQRLSHDERLRLRQAVSDLDSALDNAVMDLHLKRD
jgi:hypothetical protein